MAFVGVAALACAGGCYGKAPNACASEPAPSPTVTSRSSLRPLRGARPAQSTAHLSDIAAETGLRFVHDNGGSGALYFVEPVGAGGALTDLDSDGDLDVVLVQGHPLSGPATGTPPEAVDKPGTRVFRNDLHVDGGGQRRQRFVDVTAESGLRADRYGMGVAAGDFDNDGRADLFVTAFGENQLWRNVSGGGRLGFEEVTAEAGVEDGRWSTSAAFADLDADGHLDLFVTNYVDFRLARHRPCRSPGGRPDYCGPQSYRGATDRLYLNRGDGTFRDVSREAGLHAAPSSGLGVVAADVDGDRRLDIYVANDLERNFLWLNTRSVAGVPRFENVALERGCAVSLIGLAQASMGVVAGDVDNDGDEDLFMTHLRGDTNTLYLNEGRGLFTDRSDTSGLGSPSLSGTGFGTALVDLDNDGWLDVIVANGAVKMIEAQARAGDPYPLKQRNRVFANRQGRFVDVSDDVGEALALLEVSRGLAVGDIDNDGRSDVLLTNNEGPARLLHNRDSSGHAWLGLRLVTRDGRDALGASVAVSREGRTTLRRRSASDGSYLSSSDPRVVVGLDEDPQLSEIRVAWPGGEAGVWRGLEAGRYHTLMSAGAKIVPRGPP